MKKILVVIDMQNDFITGPLGNAECRAVVPKVADVIRYGEYDEIYATRDTHGEDYLNTQEGKKLPIAHCIKGTDGWELHPLIADALRSSGEKHKIIDKYTFGSMYLGKLLEEYLLGENVQVDFVGICTGICVISNVMIVKAALPVARICVIEDACACVTPESHRTAIEAMKTCQIDII